MQFYSLWRFLPGALFVPWHLLQYCLNSCHQYQLHLAPISNSGALWGSSRPFSASSSDTVLYLCHRVQLQLQSQDLGIVGLNPSPPQYPGFCGANNLSPNFPLDHCESGAQEGMRRCSYTHTHLGFCSSQPLLPASLCNFLLQSFSWCKPIAILKGRTGGGYTGADLHAPLHSSYSTSVANPSPTSASGFPLQSCVALLMSLVTSFSANSVCNFMPPVLLL